MGQLLSLFEPLLLSVKVRIIIVPQVFFKDDPQCDIPGSLPILDLTCDQFSA